MGLFSKKFIWPLRALLDWRQGDLAKAAKVAPATIYRLEKGEGPMMGYVSTLMRIQSAFEKAGIRFIDNDAAGGIGVRFAAPKHWGSPGRAQVPAAEETHLYI
jgi:transcriptional regulator with XRE-family HTH domain